MKVVEHDRVLAPASARERSLPAVLPLHGSDVVSVDRLIGELWGRAPPGTAGTILRVYVSSRDVRFEDPRWATLEQQIDAELAAGPHPELVGALEALIPAHPLSSGHRCGGLVPPETATRSGWSLTAGGS